jgi:hypothetical protein
MDIKQSSNYRYSIYENMDIYNDLGSNKYNYEKEGILKKCLPKILFRPNGNIVLVTFLQLIDARIIVMMKYIDKLKEFKWIANY